MAHSSKFFANFILTRVKYCGIIIERVREHLMRV